MFSQTSANELSDTQLRVAFDGDAVLFSYESERVFKEEGLEAFLENEERLKNQPLEKVFQTLFLCNKILKYLSIVKGNVNLSLS